jgi:hypothetical protein
MFQHNIDKDVQSFAHKNISIAKNTTFSIAMILLVLVSAAQNGHSVNSEANRPDGDTIFYRLSPSLNSMQIQFWNQSICFLRRKKAKLSKTKCYITVDETHDSYTGNLLKKETKDLTPQEKTIRSYIHKYKPKRGDRGSFKYLVFALVYGKKKRVLWVKALRKKEEYWSIVSTKLKELYKEVKYECALLDRGFYVADLVDQLTEDNTPFVIRSQISDYMKVILGIYREWKSYDYKIAERAETTLILGRDFRSFKWAFVTNVQFENLEDVRFVYKKRWNIENIFKATDGIQLRAATSNHRTKMFAVCLSFLIYNAWQNKNKRPTLLDFMKEIFVTLFRTIISTCPYRDKFKLNLPLWEFIELQE